MAMLHSKTPSIAIFSLAYMPFVGGAELAVKEITGRVPYRFTCFTNRFDSQWLREEQLGQVRVVRVGRGRRSLGGVGSYYGNTFQKIWYVFRAWRAAEREHRHQPFTAVWAMMAAYAGIAALLFKMRHPEVPLVLTLQEGDSEEHILGRVGMLYPLWKLLFKKADRIQVISSYLAEFARRHGARCPIDIVPNGVATEQFFKHKGSEADAPKHIITTSRLVMKNGVDVLIRAIGELKNTWPGKTYKVSVIGDGPDREQFVALAKELGLGREVEFLGHRDPADIPYYLAQADIFVRPSRSEGLGSSFLEAMAAGVPIIGTDVGGIPDFLKHGETGLFARVNDHKDLADKMKLLLTDKALRSKLAVNGLRLVHERYTWTSVAHRMQEVFSALPQVAARVLVLTGIFPPDIGGSATFSHMLTETMPAHEVSIQVVTYGAQSSPGVSVVSRQWPKGLRHLIYFLRVVWLGRRADVLLAADSSFGAAWVGAVAARVIGKPFMVRVTGDYAWEQGMQRSGITDLMDVFQTKRYGFFVELLRRCQSFAVKRAVGVIAPSEYLKKIAIGWGANPNTMTVVYNAVELGELPTRTAAREHLGLSGMVIVSAGRLVPWKGFRTLIAAFQNVAAAVRDAHLVIIGDGPDRPVIEETIRLSGLTDRIHAVGAVSKQAMLGYLRAADIFALHTGYEGFSHQIAEAMAAGVPVVTTAVGGNPELITSGTDGFLVDYNNQEALEKHLLQLAKDAALRKRFSEAGKNIVKRFSHQRMTEQLAALFTQ